VAVIASCWVGEEYDNQVACVRGGGPEKARWLLLVFASDAGFVAEEQRAQSAAVLLCTSLRCDTVNECDVSVKGSGLKWRSHWKWKSRWAWVLDV
jgi:hypothetical protein